ncbi:uncharacterized protein [Watersipora subatra]|uniref:uncharacterized protein n=1 Tax=Watersipora subatra TaxID=2589382 RepID=UPI00355C1BED
MDVLIRSEAGEAASGTTSETSNSVFQINTASNTTSSSDERSVVILRSNPLILPMVCGLCGSQYATARELESHLDMHRDGLPAAKKGRGRPKGSRNRKLEDIEEIAESPSEAPNNLPQSGNIMNTQAGSSGRPQRIVRKPENDEFVHDETELDNLLVAEDSFAKQNLPECTSSGVLIARLEDYVNSKVLVLESDAPGAPGDRDAELVSQGLLETAMGVASASSLSQDTLSLQADEAMKALISSNDLSTTSTDENMQIACEVSEENENQDNITHIEVCLETNKDGMVVDGGANKESVSTNARMCELCCVVLPMAEMREHMVSTHMKGSNHEFHCPRVGCSQLFTTIPRLRRHLSEQHPPLAGTLTPRVYPCLAPNCGTIHKSKHALKLHTSDMHSSLAEVSTACNFCPRVFKSRRAQSSHMKAHTKVLNPVRCEKCFKEFRHPSALKFHMSMMPNCDKPKYVCAICGYKAVTPWRLNSHQKQVHSTSRPYTCEYCHKTYKTNEMLRQHTYKLHTGTPTYECEVCNKKFFYAAELREHSQLHNTTKQFVCPICHRAFKTMHVFRGHMNGKHSDTWYSCGFCKFTTSHKKSMKRHMVLVHKLKNVTLEVTPEEPQHQQVEVIQGDGELIQLSDSGHVVGSIHQMQYEDVGNVVIQNNNGEIITPEQLAREVNVTGGMIASQQIHVEGDMMTTQTITEEQMDDSFRHLITHERTVNEGEVSEVLVSLSAAGGPVESSAIPSPIATDTVITSGNS